MKTKKSQIELHAHPDFEKYSLETVIQTMDKKDLDIIALEYLNDKIFSEIQTYIPHLRNKGYNADSDDIAVRIEKEGKESYILKAIELWSEDNFHLITIGSDSVKPYQPIRKMIDLALKEKAFVIFDHPFVSNYKVWEEISEQKGKEVRKICKEYSNNLALEWNGYCLKEYWSLREKLGGKDVNKEVIKLSRDLDSDGYNNPVVTDTDVHARSKGALKAIGTGKIISDIDLKSGRTIVDSLKQNIFSDNYENTYKTVPLFSHFIPYFAIPHLANKVLKVVNRSRGEAPKKYVEKPFK